MRIEIRCSPQPGAGGSEKGRLVFLVDTNTTVWFGYCTDGNFDTEPSATRRR